uniref:Uncharacterized protein n=1 Tax=Romanomermis culicivorax TaxID=13658 RepID=A0A915K2X4_ROMCU
MEHPVRHLRQSRTGAKVSTKEQRAVSTELTDVDAAILDILGRGSAVIKGLRVHENCHPGEGAQYADAMIGRQNDDQSPEENYSAQFEKT